MRIGGTPEAVQGWRTAATRRAAFGGAKLLCGRAKAPKRPEPAIGWLAERGRFELPVPVKVRPLSRRVRSTTLPPLRSHHYIIRSAPPRRNAAETPRTGAV